MTFIEVTQVPEGLKFLRRYGPSGAEISKRTGDPRGHRKRPVELSRPLPEVADQGMVIGLVEASTLV